MVERTPSVIAASQVDRLIEALLRRGYEVLGPTVRDGAIVHGAIRSAAELPAGWTDDQAPGRYRLRRRPDQALFGHALGPHGWKAVLHAPEVRLFAAERRGTSFRILDEGDAPAAPTALLGVRACELAAMAALDRVLLGDGYADPRYRARRDASFIVAVQCTEPAATCFCASMGTAPPARAGYDLALTELLDAAGHRLLVEVGSDRGAELLPELEAEPAGAEDAARAAEAVAAASRRQARAIDRAGLPELLRGALEHPRWEETAARCLGCASCTMVCPTCFCTAVEDTTDVSGARAERWRRWDSCFTLSFSYIHGGSVRASARSRYRQWLTHKLASWVEQFGTSGCVGCGRCITWCPAGIDITEEVRAFRGAGSHGNA